MAFKKLHEVERIYTLKVLEYYHGNRTRTAKALGVSYRTLSNRISAYRSQGFKVVENHTSETLRQTYIAAYKRVYKT